MKTGNEIKYSKLQSIFKTKKPSFNIDEVKLKNKFIYTAIHKELLNNLKQKNLCKKNVSFNDNPLTILPLNYEVIKGLTIQSTAKEPSPPKLIMKKCKKNLSELIPTIDTEDIDHQIVKPRYIYKEAEIVIQSMNQTTRLNPSPLNTLIKPLDLRAIREKITNEEKSSSRDNDDNKENQKVLSLLMKDNSTQCLNGPFAITNEKEFRKSLNNNYSYNTFYKKKYTIDHSLSCSFYPPIDGDFNNDSNKNNKKNTTQREGNVKRTKMPFKNCFINIKKKYAQRNHNHFNPNENNKVSILMNMGENLQANKGCDKYPSFIPGHIIKSKRYFFYMKHLNSNKSCSSISNIEIKKAFGFK